MLRFVELPDDSLLFGNRNELLSNFWLRYKENLVYCDDDCDVVIHYTWKWNLEKILGSETKFWRRATQLLYSSVPSSLSLRWSSGQCALDLSANVMFVQSPLTDGICRFFLWPESEYLTEIALCNFASIARWKNSDGPPLFCFGSPKKRPPRWMDCSNAVCVCVSSHVSSWTRSQFEIIVWRLASTSTGHGLDIFSELISPK